MKKITLLVALAIAWPAAAQTGAPEQKNEAAKPVAKAAKAPKATKAAKKSKRQEDARHCLQQGDNDAIIRCAEEYL